MIKDRFLKGILVVIALLLALNLFGQYVSPIVATDAVAKSPQKITFRGNGIGIACSNDGKFVYAAGNGNIIRSADYGKSGTWEAVLAN